MAKTRIEKIATIEEEMRLLEVERKKLLAQEKEQAKKDRTKRLCKRAGLLESLLPDTIALTDEQFKTFLEKTVANDFGRRTLANITPQKSATPETKESTETVTQDSTRAVIESTGAAARDNSTPSTKPPQTAQQGGAGARTGEGNGTRVSG